MTLEAEDAPAGQALPAAGPDVFADDAPLAELHAHLGGSVPIHVLWEIAHAAGVAVPVKDYWEFAELVAVPDQGVAGLPGLDEVYHLVERIQSSPAAVERAVHAMIGGGYRAQRITTVEVRFNPAKRNRGGETDLDHVILAALRAVDRAALEYPAVRAGVVLMCDRTFDRALNETIVAKALRWADRGVVGIDIAGPRPGVGAAGPDQLSPGPRSERQRAPQAGPDQPSPGPRSDRFPYADLADAFAAARAAGLGVTVHAGEEGEPDELGEVVETLRPDRVGHGVLAAHRPDLCRQLIAAGVVLEVCPTSNLRTGVFGSVDELVDAVRSLHAAGVPLTVSTDGPTMQRTNLRDEHALLVSAGAWRAEDAHVANQRAFDASFCRPAR